MKKVLLIFNFILLIFPLYNAAQKSPKNKESLTIKANILVYDEKNQYINGIKQEDIRIFEDGVEQKVTYFAEKQPVLNLGFVIDNTGSIQKDLNEISWAGSYITTNLREEDEAFVTRFVSSDKISLDQDWTSDKKSLIETFNNFYIEGGKSAVLDALYLSGTKLLERAKVDKNKKYALLLISDVEDLDSYYKIDETIKLFKDTDSQIFIISYAEGRKKKAKPLGDLLSLETGGTIYQLSEKHTREELQKILGKIVIELRSNYVISYTSTNQKRDGLARKLSVQIADAADGKKQSALIRENFIVPQK